MQRGKSMVNQPVQRFNSKMISNDQSTNIKINNKKLFEKGVSTLKTENSIFYDNVDPTPSVIGEQKSPRGSLISDKVPNIIVQEDNEKTKSKKELLQNLDV